MSTPSLREIMGVVYVIYHQYYHGIRVGGFTAASSGNDVVMVGYFLSLLWLLHVLAKWHCQVSLVASPVVYETLYLASRSCYKLKVTYR